MLANVDWVMVVIAGAMLLFFAGRRSFVKTFREMNESMILGDHARRLKLAMSLHRSMTPFMIYLRWIQRGFNHWQIASSYYLLGQYEQALNWAQQGLTPRCKSETQFLLHWTAMSASGYLGHGDEADKHYQAAKQLPKIPQHMVAHFENAYGASLRASGALQDALKQSHHSQAYDVVQSLHFGGYYAEACKMTDAMIENAKPLMDAYRRPDNGRDDPHLLQRAQQHAALLQPVVAAYVSACAAFELGCREDFVRYFRAVCDFSDLGATHQLLHRNLAMCAAAFAGDVDGVDRWSGESQAICQAYPENRSYLAIMNSCHAGALLKTGRPQQALDVLAEAPEAPSTEIAAEFALLRNQSFVALAQNDKAQEQLALAAKLMPDHWRVRESQGKSLPLPLQFQEEGRDYPEDTTSSASAPQQENVTTPSHAPVAPVISRLGNAMWPLAFFALIPFLGSIVAIVLVPLALVLLFRKRKLPHDRRVAIAGLAVSMLSLASISLTIWHHATFESLYASIPDPWISEITLEHPEMDAVFETPAIAQDSSNESVEDVMGDAEQDDESFIAEQELDEQAGDSMLGSWQASVGLFVILIVSIILHEIAHGVAAYWGGDPTAKDQNRFSLNPLHHISWVGSVIVPLFLVLMPGDALIGWAKPVPITPYRLRRPTKGMLGVSLAGVSVNLMLAFLASHVFAALTFAYCRMTPLETWAGWLPLEFFTYGDETVSGYWVFAWAVCFGMIVMNSLLAGFNLLPIPPLDGFNFLRTALPKRVRPIIDRLAGGGMVFLLVIMATGLLGSILQLLIQPALIIAAWPAIPLGAILAAF